MTMIQRAVIPGLKLTNATGLKKFEFSEEGRRIGAIPGWRLFIDPKSRYRKEGQLRNRYIAGKYLAKSEKPQVSGQFQNGAPALVYDSNNRVDSDAQINKEAWTAFAVVRLSSADNIGASKDILRANRGATQGNFTPRLSFANSGNSIGIYQNTASTTSIINYARAGGYLDQTVLVMFTFSTRDGLRIFADGVEGARAPDFVTPFDAQDTPGTWGFFGGGIRGLVGHAGLLDVDLGWEEYTNERIALEKFMLETYGIVK